MREYRRMTYSDRLKLEALYNSGMPVVKIAEKLGFFYTGIYREIQNGKYQRKNSDWTYSTRYSADRAQQMADFKTAARSKPLKIGNDYAFVRYAEDMILNRRYSPEAVLAEIEKKGLHFDTKISVRTFYRYIDQGVFPNLTRKSLPYKGKRKKQQKKTIEKTESKIGTSIEKRPPEIETRETFGNWEMDSVIGKREKGQTMLVFTERKTNMEFVFRSNDKGIHGTVNILDRVERKLGKKIFQNVFKTITCDNGTEFNCPDLIERSSVGRGLRTTVYYCHPYCSSERGSNEKQNQMLRRWVAKGTKIETYTDTYLSDVESWLNNYPRRKYDYKSSIELFTEELSKLGIKNFFEKFYI